jgi:molybdenum cofactor cytidylyltransferase
VRAKPQAALIVLADMPMVSPGHVANLLEALSYGEDLIASSNGSVAMPPALFGRRYFERLLRLSGERGAQHLLANARRIEAAPGELVDVDRPQDAMAQMH